MVRIRIPGGQTTGAALGRLGDLAQAYGSGLLQLTARGSVQVRGLADPVPAGFVDGIAAAGLLPSTSHERVRNLVVSPLTGLHEGQADLRAMTAALDRALMATPDLAGLSGRFLFALDDGRADVLTLPFDVAYQAADPERGVLITATGRRPVAAVDAVDALLAGARSGAGPTGPIGASVGPPPGAVGEHASVTVPLGFLTPEQLAAVRAASGNGPVVVTPWRGLVIPHAAGALADLAAVGLVVDDASPWTLISACVGAPYCGLARMATLTEARALARRSTPGGLRRTHLSGCERRCGAPAYAHVDLVADAGA